MRHGSVRPILLLVLVGVLVACAALVLLREEGALPEVDDLASETPAPPDRLLAESTARLAGRPPSQGKASTRETLPVREGDGAGTAPSGIRFLGRVLAPDGHPAVAAVVTPHSGRRVGESVITDAEGRFVLPAWRPPPSEPGEALMIVARAQDGRVATKPARRLHAGSPAEIRIGTLVLEGGAALDVEVRAPGGEGIPATVIVRSVGERLTGEILAQEEADGEGRVRFNGLPPGTALVLAHAPGWGRGQVVTAVPREGDGPAVVTTAQPRRLEVVVGDKVSRAPVVGATIEIWEQVRPQGAFTWWPYVPHPEVQPTDEAGRTFLDGLGRTETLHLLVTARDHPPGRGVRDGYAGWGMGHRVAPEATRAEIWLDPARSIRWPLTEEGGPIPPDGTPLRLRQRAATPVIDPTGSARVEGRAIVGEGLRAGHLDMLASAPDGSIAVLFAPADADVGRETTFRPSARVRLRATTPDGRPATGLWMVLFDEGNNPMRQAAALDAQGIAVEEGLFGGLAGVHLSETGDPWPSRRVGTVDLERGGGEIDVVVQPVRRAVLSVHVEGEPRLPAGTTVAIPTPALPEEDFERAELRFPWRPEGPGGSVAVMVQAPGHVPARVTLEAGEGDAPDRARVDLQRAGTLVVRTRLPAGERARILAQRWDEQAQAWTFDASQGTHPGRHDPDGVSRFDALPPGRYRVVEATVGKASEAALVGAGRHAEIAFDLGRMGWVRGRVEAPEGADLRGVRVGVTGTEVDLDSLGPYARSEFGVSPDGTFTVRVPGDREVALAPRHHVLRAAPEGGVARVSSPREDVVLRMVSSAMATVRLDEAPALPPRRRGHDPVRVCLHRGEPTGAPAFDLRGELQTDGMLRFGGYEAGTWTVWIDVPGRVPVVIRGLPLGDEPSDLGTVRTSPGATLRVRLQVRDGERVPHAVVQAVHLAEPAYVRWANMEGGAEVEVPGLGPGPFEVSVGIVGSTVRSYGPARRFSVESHGAGVIERTVDLR